MAQRRIFQPTSMLKYVNVVVIVYGLIHLFISPAEAGCKTIQTGSTFCCDTTCPKGNQPVCSPNLPISSLGCERCPPQTYAPTVTSPLRKCQLKKVCSSPGMIYKNLGSTETDAVCGCIDGLTYIEHKEICEQNHVNTSFSPSTPSCPGVDLNAIAVMVCFALFFLTCLTLCIWFNGSSCRRSR